MDFADLSTKHIPDDRWKVALLVPKERLNVSCRELVRRLASLSDTMRLGSAERLPHHKIPRKFIGWL